MSRPLPDPTTLVSGQEGWDAVIRDLIAAVVSYPFPVKQYDTIGDFPAASMYDRCLAATVDTNKLYFSDGSTWREVTLAAP